MLWPFDSEILRGPTDTPAPPFWVLCGLNLILLCDHLMWCLPTPFTDGSTQLKMVRIRSQGKESHYFSFEISNFIVEIRYNQPTKNHDNI